MSRSGRSGRSGRFRAPWVTPAPSCRGPTRLSRTKEQTSRAGTPRTRRASIVPVVTRLNVSHPNSGQKRSMAGRTRRTSIETGPEGIPYRAISLHVPHTDPRFCILIRPTKSTRPCSSLISLHRRKTQKKYRRALGILCPHLQRLNGAHRGVAQSSPCARRLSTGSAGAG